MKALPILVFAILWPLYVVSQTPYSGQVKGRIVDTDLKTGLSGATIALVHAKDSTPTSYSAMTSERGGFLISGIVQGAYKAYVTYLGYQPQLLSKEILVSTSNLDLGDIALKKKTIQLKEIEISETRAPFVMRKDTIEFRADYYKTRETSPMEALLKKLPGLEITPDGVIKYNGKVVEAILIDGRPFFGDDIKKATKNLLAGIIETVQIIDRESNNPDRSLSNSENQEKVINLTLKKSVYGRLNGVIGADVGNMGKYKFNANLNKFGHQSQVSLISGGDNISNFESDGGIPENPFSFWKAGVNYTTDLNSKMVIGVSYSYDHINQDGNSTTSRQNIFTDSTTNYHQSSLSKFKNNVHSGNLNFNYNIDSFTNLSFKGNLTISSMLLSGNNAYSTMSDNRMVNDGTHLLLTNGNKYFTNNNITFNHRFKKIGRKLKLSLNYLWLKESNRNESTNITRYLLPNNSIWADSLKQYSRSNDGRLEASINLDYAEPITKNILLSLFYNYNRFDNPYSKNTYDFNPVSAKVDLINDSLSGRLQYSKYVHTAGAIFKIQIKKFNFDLGANMVSVKQEGGSNLNPQSYILNIHKFFPLINIDFRLNTKSKIYFDYSRRLIPPQRQQLYIIPNVSNPLFIAKGNANLRPSTSDRFNLSYQSIDPYSNRSLSILGSIVFTQNQIVTTLNYDTFGRMLSVPINLNGFSNGSLFIVNGFQYKAINSIVSTTTSITWNKDVNLIDHITTNVNRGSISQGLNINYHHGDNLYLSASVNATYSLIRYTSDPTLNTDYSDYLIVLNTSINLPGKFIFAPAVNYRMYTGRPNGFNNSSLILNFTLSKAFLKSQALAVKVQGFDVLNQNYSISRTVGPGFIEDMESNALRRFFMIGAVYYIK